jgi:hypothetical protein
LTSAILGFLSLPKSSCPAPVSRRPSTRRTWSFSVGSRHRDRYPNGRHGTSSVRSRAAAATAPLIHLRGFWPDHIFMRSNPVSSEQFMTVPSTCAPASSHPRTVCVDSSLSVSAAARVLPVPPPTRLLQGTSRAPSHVFWKFATRDPAGPNPVSPRPGEAGKCAPFYPPRNCTLLCLPTCVILRRVLGCCTMLAGAADAVA